MAHCAKCKRPYVKYPVKIKNRNYCQSCAIGYYKDLFAMIRFVGKDAFQFDGDARKRMTEIASKAFGD